MKEQNKETQDITTLPFMEKAHDSLLEKWQQDIDNNPKFADTPFSDPKASQEYTKEFLGNIANALSDETIPKVSSDDMRHLFTVWQSIRKAHEPLSPLPLNASIRSQSHRLVILRLRGIASTARLGYKHDSSIPI